MADHYRRPSTRIAGAKADQIVVRGEDLAEQIGTLDFTTMICQSLAGGRTPSPGEIAVANACLVAISEHGITPSAIAARLVYDSSPESIQGALAAGLLGAGSQFLGTTENCGRLLQEAVAAGGEATTAERASTLVDAVLVDQKFFPGFGHPVHKSGDPRTPALFAVAERESVAGAHVELVRAVGAEIESRRARPVPLNATGAIAAVLSDAGFHWRSLRGFSLVARSAGLVAHILEEAANPTARHLWDVAEREIPYVGEWPDGDEA
jgi:citrate synthase